MKQLVRQPCFWLVGLAVIVLFNRLLTGMLVPTFVRDSPGYVEFDWSEPLSQKRTIGYPLFLAVTSLFGGDQRAVPVAHWIALTSACGVFYWGLRRVGYSAWTAGWCAATLLLGRSVIDLGHQVIGDSLALSLSIAATGCFLATRRSAVRSWPFVGCAVLTFLAYQVRPAYLFLLPLWPVASLWIEMTEASGRTMRMRASRATAFAAATLLPFLAFCGLRAVTVGHFGLVPFGGYNIVGVAGQILDDRLVNDLPSDLQPLGKEIMRLRKEHDESDMPVDFLTMEKRFNSTIWQMAVPAANAIYDDDTVEVNQALSKLSKQVIRQRPQAYVHWLVGNTNHARQQLTQLTVFDKGTLLVGLLLIYAHLSSLVVGVRRRSSVANTEADVQHRERHIVFWIAILFALAKTSLVVLVEPANDRYMTPAMVFLPAVLAVFTAQYAQRVLCPRVG